MNTKYKDFQISNLIVVIFSILIVLVINSFLIEEFGFTKDNFVLITIFLLIVGAFLYYFLSKQLLESLFKSDETIENQIKETLHELNTPVATIQMNTKILQKKEQDEKNIARLSRIEQSCENLLDLYNQMEYGIKEQIDKVHSELFDIDEIIVNSIDKFTDIKKDITIEYNKSTLFINADKKGFLKVIDNLISNAIKYNKPDGKIIINLENHILKVSDTGIGIDTQSLFHIFDKYYQENSLSSGVGLGLNIIKSYCDRYKIDIKIDSKKDEGTTFYLDLKGLVNK
ncbi:MAG: HAMP domain-containing sensor histidine kinase [Campylobacterota bacterium]|nr:HAMP domain-containing sensor histidine kinase [Campylobacterota bacterium]